MKRFIITLTAIAAFTVCASAQMPASFNDGEKTPLTSNPSSAEDSVLSHIRILPNPSSGMIVLMVDDVNAGIISSGELVIYNSGGYPVARKPFTTGTNDIFVNNLGSGIYFMRLMPKNGMIAVKEFAVAR